MTVRQKPADAPKLRRPPTRDGDGQDEVKMAEEESYEALSIEQRLSHKASTPCLLAGRPRARCGDASSELINNRRP